MKAVYVGGTCDLCEYIIQKYPEICRPYTELVEGRVYTIVLWEPVELDGHSGFKARTAEVLLPEGWGHCGCGFREIEGDEDAWKRMMHEHRPKKVLEPA